MIKQIIIVSLLINYSFAACTASSTSATGTGGAGANDYAAGKCCYTDQTTSVKAPGVATCASKPTANATPQEAGAATCNANYSFGSATCTACTANTHYAAAGTTGSCTQCANSKCCLSATDGSATVRSTGVATCATGAAGAIGDAVNAATCDTGYYLTATNTCKQNECRASQTQAAYRTEGGVRCCFVGSAFILGTGVATCPATGTANTEADPATCDAGYSVVGGKCVQNACRASQTQAAYRTEGGMKCCYVGSAFILGTGVATCPATGTANTEAAPLTCDAGYSVVDGACKQNPCRASQTQAAYRTEGGQKCCFVGSAFILGTAVATCPATGTANTESAPATCDAGYSVVDGACKQNVCRAAQTEAAYGTQGGMKCCWLSSSSTLKAPGVASCSATVPTAVGEYDALTCSAGYYLSTGTCKPLCAATTTDADYVVNGKQCCYATTTLNAIKGAGVATCATAPTAVGEYLAATCSAGYLLTAGVCEKICSPTTADAAAYANNGGNKCCSKDKDNNFKGKGVNTCTAVDPTKFTATAEVNALGCDANYYLSSGACVACAADRFSAVNSTTADACQAKDKAPAGTIYDETTKSFLRCSAPCATCAGSVTKCASCIVNVPDFKEPASGDANYETLLKTYQFDNATATCLSSCAEGFKLQDVKTRAKCIESSTSGLFAIILSVFSIFISLL